MLNDYTSEELDLVAQIGRENGEEVDNGYYSHRIKREELARRIRDHPDLGYEEPRELAEFLHSIGNSLDIVKSDEYYEICRSDEDREQEAKQEIDDLTNEFQDL